jgi:hypothetical protein
VQRKSIVTDKQLKLYLDSICKQLEQAIQQADKELGNKVQRDAIVPLDNETGEPLPDLGIDLGVSALGPLRKLLESLRSQANSLVYD